MTPATLHSRSVLAGYDPALLSAGKILVVGLGALGQNVVQNLSLIGIGRLMLVDFDAFEGHNATRSPFYPTRDEIKSLGNSKAAVVAHRSAQVATASDARVFYSASPVQVLGDGAVAWADIVVSAVDSLNARAWLAERSRLLERPMVEGGFSGPYFNLSAFAPAAEAACYRCGRPERASSMSCTAYALAAERAQIVPAIQTSAAVLGGYLAEQVVQLLHGSSDRLGYRSYGDVRQESLYKALLTADERCPGIHRPQPLLGTVRGLPARPVLQDLVTAISRHFGGGRLHLAEHVIPKMSCTACTTPCLVQAAESTWLANPRCAQCGGPWPVTETFGPDCVKEFDTDDHLSAELAGLPLDNIGLRHGASLTAFLRDGRVGRLRLDGDILACVERATSRGKAALHL